MPVRLPRESILRLCHRDPRGSGTMLRDYVNFIVAWTLFFFLLFLDRFNYLLSFHGSFSFEIFQSCILVAIIVANLNKR